MSDLSSNTAEHYTPGWIIDKVKNIFGGEIDCDPCAAPDKRLWFATLNYAKATNGLTLPWGRKTFVNPPGDRRGQGPKEFWRYAAEQIITGRTSDLIWLAFNVSQLRVLQRVEPVLLSSCAVCIPKDRIKFSGDSPTRDNAILHFSTTDNHLPFVEEFVEVGAIWVPQC